MDNLSESSILRRIDCRNWSNISPDKVPYLIQLLPFMAPEVADKALDVVLSVPELATEMKRYTQQLLDESLRTNEKTTAEAAIIDRRIVESLILQMDRPDLSSEERREIRNDLKELSERMHISSSENRSWISHVIETAQNHDNILLAAAGVIVGGFLGLFVGKKVFSKDDQPKHGR